MITRGAPVTRPSFSARRPEVEQASQRPLHNALEETKLLLGIFRRHPFRMAGEETNEYLVMTRPP